MGKECVAAVQDMGNSIDLVRSESNLWADTAKYNMASVILTRADGIECVVVIPHQSAPSCRIFPDPILKCLFDSFLLCLRCRGFFGIEYGSFIAVFIIHIIKNTGITQV